MANNTFDNRKFMDYAINHVNDDHWKEMVQIVQANTTIRDVSDVTLLDYNPKGMEVIVARNNRDEQKIQINFPCVLNSPMTLDQYL
ncbi:MAG: DUF2470 domain-containing protein [Bacteroidota bacterium]